MFNVVMLSLDQIELTPDNPRIDFSKKDLKELSESLRTDGMIEPIIVRKVGPKYTVVVGERRARAAAFTGLTRIPAIVRDVNDEEASRLRLIENLTRKDLDVFETVAGIKAHMSKYGMNMKQMATVLHKSPATVQGWFKVAESTSPNVRRSDKLRLLGLELLRELSKYNDETQEKLAEAIVDHGLIVHQARRFLTAFDRRPDLRKIDEIAARMKAEYKTVTITLPASKASEIRRNLEREAHRQDREKSKAKDRLRKHLRPKVARSSKVTGSRGSTAFEKIDVPYEAKSGLEEVISNPSKQLELAKQIQEQNFDESEIGELINLAKRQPQLSASELVDRYIEDSDKRGKIRFMVVELKPKFNELLKDEAEKRKGEPRKILVELAAERLSELGYEM
jgi:ParB family chromosome partitioning protein